jgi:hypothetical protein
VTAVPAVLTPRIALAGRYARRHVANARLAVEGAGDGRALVATDSRGRRHAFPLDGSADAPASVGVVLMPAGRRGSVDNLVVADARGRALVRDRHGGLWLPGDVVAFADAAGLRALSDADVPPVDDATRRVASLEPSPWPLAAGLLAVLPLGAGLAVAGVSGAAAAVVIAVVVVALLAAQFWVGTAHFAAYPAPDPRLDTA